MKMNILVSGWLGINHSYALVNYFQLKYLRSKVNVYFQETGYYCKGWEQSKKDADITVRKYNNEPIDCIYRISFPYVIEDTDKKQFLFYTAEFAEFIPEHFNKSLEQIRELVEQKKLVLITPSAKSAKAFLKNGIPVEIIPHGYDSTIYYKTKENLRATLDIKENSKVFLNVSAFSGNKNLHIIIYTFIHYHNNYNKNSYLILKGVNLYKSKEAFDKIVKDLLNSGLLAVEMWLKAKRNIKLLIKDYDFNEMRNLYNTADVYIDAGIHEGFTLPVLEAKACGLKVFTAEEAPLAHLADGNFVSDVDLLHLMLDYKGGYREQVDLAEYKWESVVDRLLLLVENRKG
jgi:general stress protein 26